MADKVDTKAAVAEAGEGKRGLVGGASGARPVNDEEAAIALKVQADIAAKAGATFDTFKPVSVSTQVVAGVNYFFKIDVGNGKFVHARVFQDLPHNNSALSVHSVQTDKSADDALTYF